MLHNKKSDANIFVSETASLLRIKKLKRSSHKAPHSRLQRQAEPEWQDYLSKIQTQ